MKSFHFKLLSGLIIFAFFTLYCSIMLPIPLLGDEKIYYFNAAQGFADIIKYFFTLNWNQIPQIWNNEILAKGFFIPGSSLFLSPVRLFSDDVSFSRIFMGGLNYILLYFIVLKTKKLFGVKTALLLLIISLINPTYSTVSFTFWGEALAGKFTLLLLIYLFQQTKKEKETDLSFKNIFVISILLIGAILCRHSYILLAPFSVVILTYLYIFHWGYAHKTIVRFTSKISILTLLVSFPLLFWSYSLSNKYGCCFYTTTTVDLGFISKMAPEFFIDSLASEGFIAVKSNLNTQPLHNYYVKTAKQNELTYAYLVKSDKKRFQKKFSLEQFAEEKRKRYSKIAQQKNSILNKFKKSISTKNSKTKSPRSKLFLALISIDSLIWKVNIIAIFMAFLLLIKPTKSHLDLSLILKLFLIACALQLFIRFGQIRHTYGLFPILSYFLARLATGFPILKFNQQYKIYEKLNIIMQVLVILIIMSSIIIFYFN